MKEKIKNQINNSLKVGALFEYKHILGGAAAGSAAVLIANSIKKNKNNINQKQTDAIKEKDPETIKDKFNSFTDKAGDKLADSKIGKKIYKMIDN